MTHPLTRFLIRTWPLLLALAALILMPAALSQTREGRVAVRTSIYLPDMVLQVPLPWRPIELISDPPTRERVEIRYESRNGPRTIDADLYTPAGDRTGRHGVVFSMGAPPLDLDDKRLVRIAEDSARAGVVMLVPFSERLDDERIAPEEIDALVAAFKFMQAQPSVDPQKVGFFGASVGGSLAIVAAADPRIAGDVDHVVSFGGYFDALYTSGAIATGRIRYQDVDEEWDPQRHARKVMAIQIIDEVRPGSDQDVLWRHFVRREPQEAQELASLGPLGRGSYDFLVNRDPEAIDRLIEGLPPEAIAKLEYLSPSTSIDDVQAEMIIVHDRADPYIPWTELRRMRDATQGNDRIQYQELRLFEHVTPNLRQRPEIITLDSTRLLYRLYQLLLRWDEG